MRIDFAQRRCCPTELRQGEARRVPVVLTIPIIGLYVGCPFCGKLQTILSKRVNEHTGQTFTEDEAGVTMSPGHECDRCHRSFVLIGSEVVELPK